MQTHAIIPKILEVDRAITPELQQRVREAHPEVSFRMINGSPLLHSKRATAGCQERLKILEAQGLVFDPVQERLRLGRSQVGFDDLIDAAACLLTARRVAASLARLLGNEARDGCGLKMEIAA